METEKHWTGDTLNSQGTIVFQIRNDKELFVLNAVSNEVILNRSEAEFLLSSLKRALTVKD